MAIYHFSGTVISRSQGRSAIACAAYRSCEKLHDVRYGKTHDYTKKQDIAYAEILLPKDAPDLFSNRETLWNYVEANEKRKDAQLAREFNFALPRELSMEKNIVLAREFVQEAFVSKGMIADMCIHNDKISDGEMQPHVHVMLTMRQITPEGFGQKVREWNSTELLKAWREGWANIANHHLALHGFDLRIDHRSNIDQGIDLEPQYKIGSALAREHLARLEDHQRIARENGQAILKDPNIALTAITRQQSTFSHQDLARFVNRHTVDAEQFQQVYGAIKASKELCFLGQDDKGRDRFTTHEMFNLEKRFMEQAKELDMRAGHAVVRTSQTKTLTHYQLTPEQTAAFEHITHAADLECLIGYAGTGKSYLLGAAREAWEGQGYRVLGATLSGIAAENLTNSSGIESRTLASYFYQWDRERELLTDKDILVVDEAGMVGSRQMAKLIEQAHDHGAKVVLIGDPEQLQAIEAGAAFRAIAEQVGYVSLTEIRRQREDWQKEATKDLANHNTHAALKAYQQHDHMHKFETTLQAKINMVELWNDVRINQPDITQIMLAYTRTDVRELNEMARTLRRDQGELGIDKTIQTERGERLFAEQDRIYFLKNERSLGVKNGTLGTIEAIHGKQLTVRLDSQDDRAGRVITVETRDYNQLDHGYAATFHKAQGVTVDRSYLLASKHLDAHATYVGLSRHRDSTDIFYSREDFPCAQDLISTLKRERHKDVTLDYLGQEKSLSLFATEKFKEANEDLITRLQRIREEVPFEKTHPEEVNTLKNEQKALDAIEYIQALEKAIENSRMPLRAKAELERYSFYLNKETDVMDYVRLHDSAIAEKVQEITKMHENNLSIERKRSLDRDMDF